MILSIIVAASENNAIGRDNALLWHISTDLKRFKQLTTGHTVIMGRKTFESIGKALPYRRNIVVSRNPAFQAKGCEVVNTLEQALQLTEQEEEVFIIGGGMLYREVWDCADRLYLTRVHIKMEGDTYIPAISSDKWNVVAKTYISANEKEPLAYSFIDYFRKE